MRGPSLETLENGVLAGDRVLLARAITLIESEHPTHQQNAQTLLTRLMPHTGNAFRLGISGTPGAGKSTFIERFGTRRTAKGRKVAVLAIDPSSRISGGSILGDKTRMEMLSRDPLAFIRPSPTSGTLGGVARKTREALLLCEAAGFDDVLVETVGVGQSETLVAEMVDVTLLLLLPGGGDGLQGIKRGILESADFVAIHKADGDRLNAAAFAQRELSSALRLMRGREVPTFTCSSLTGDGMPELEDALNAFIKSERANGGLAQRRRGQNVRWMWRLIEDGLRTELGLRLGDRKTALEEAVREGKMGASQAAADALKEVLGGAIPKAVPQCTTGG